MTRMVKRRKDEGHEGGVGGGDRKETEMKWREKGKKREGSWRRKERYRRRKDEDDKSRKMRKM